MAAALRSNMLRHVQSNILLSKAVAKQLPLLHQVASISSKIYRDLNGIKRPKPFDYVNRRYNYWVSLLDGTSHRFDENSKIVLVEGPLAAGKTEFGQELARQLDMRYMEHANMDQMFINSYGFDLRTLDAQLPKGARSFDETKFLADPANKMTGVLQSYYYLLRYYNYIEALAHVFSTGQGVVLDRSAYSDIVFIESLYRNQYISRNVHRALHAIRDNTLIELLKPHLVVYLDVPVDNVQKRIKERNKYGEANSPLFKDNKFITTMEDVYKQEFLQEIATHSEILVYDWSTGGDVELVVEDIERIDFNRFEKYEEKMKDWRFMPHESDWCEMRMQYTEDASLLHALLNVPVYYAPELLIEPEDDQARDKVFAEAPGMEYAYGYNAKMGDTGIAFKGGRIDSNKNAIF